MRYTQKQIEKYNRQKYMTELEKVSKNLFRMFRNREVDAAAFTQKVSLLKERLEKVEKIPIDLGYYRELEAYITRLFQELEAAESFDDEALEKMRESEMSRLNRLQKLKNSQSYRKAKHKGKNEDWE